MKLKEFCCDASRQAYRNYYINQAGSGMPIFIGSKNQRGHGLGSILSGLFKSAAPLLKKGLSSLGKNAFKTGLSIAGDVLEGRSAAESARMRGSEGIKGLIEDSGLFSNEPNSEEIPRKRKRFNNSGRSRKSKRSLVAGDTLD